MRPAYCCAIGLTMSLAYAVALPGQDRNSLSCQDLKRESSVYRVRWDLNGSLLPCEHDLQPHGVVVVVLQGANTAVAKYRLEPIAVRDASATGTATQPSSPSITAAAPAAPAAPSFKANLLAAPSVVAEVAGLDTSAAAVAALDAKRQARVKDLIAFQNVRTFIHDNGKFLNGLGDVPNTLLCQTDSISSLAIRTDYWFVAQAAATLHRTIRLTLDGVLPPVTRERIEKSQNCVDRILASSTYGGLVARGSSLAARAFTESKAHIDALRTEAATYRDALNGMTFNEFTSTEQSTLNQERQSLLRQLAELAALAERVARHDFTEEALTSVINSLQQSSRWVEVIRSSSSEAVVEVSLDGGRGRSRNIVAAWEPALADVAVPAGKQTVLVDRFRGWLLNVSGSAGFAGIRKHEIIRGAAFDAQGKLMADSVKLVPNSSYTWGPALSTGLSGTYHWRNGFYVGLGIDLMVLTDDEGNATTRIATPILHIGRDDTRLFFGPILGASDRFAFKERDNLRIARTADIPDNLILKKNNANLYERLYIGVIVGQSSLDPTKLKQ